MRRTQLANPAYAKRLDQQQLARTFGLLRLSLEMQRNIFSYAIDGDRRDIRNGNEGNLGRQNSIRYCVNRTLDQFPPTRIPWRKNCIGLPCLRIMPTSYKNAAIYVPAMHVLKCPPCVKACVCFQRSTGKLHYRMTLAIMRTETAQERSDWE